MGNVDKTSVVFHKNSCGKLFRSRFISYSMRKMDFDAKNALFANIILMIRRCGWREEYMKIEFLYDRTVINLPGGVVGALSRASAEELRVLVALAAQINEISQLSAISCVPADRIPAALRFWTEAGVIAAEDLETESTIRIPSDRPAYSGEEMERICSESDVKELIDVCSAILGKTFTPTETESILYLHDGLRLDFEYIVKLCKHCYDIGKPALRYIEKVGISLYDSGAVTVGALDAYIEKEERKSDMEYRIRNLFGLGERALTPKEREYLSVWTIDWSLSFELIELAYNDMMAAISQPKFSYENGILKKWVEAGCRTKEDVVAFAEKHKKSGKAADKKKKEIGFDLDEFFDAATRRGAAAEKSK